MRSNVWTRRLCTFAMIMLIAPHALVAQRSTYLEKDYYFREPGYVASPVIGSDLSRITPQEFKNMVTENRKAFENDPNATIVSPDRDGRGINIVFNCTNVPPEAMAALESVAVYIETLFDDDVTVSISVSYASLPAGVIGWAISYLAPMTPWTTVQSSLVSDMDADDSVEAWLPTTNTIPVRYTYSSSTVTNENQVEFRIAPYNAAIGPYSGLCAQVQFSTNFTFDYDPSDGVTGMCFQSVAVHEVGHVLGFGSNADGTGMDIEVMDIYRFQNSDGTGDFNPDTWSEFQTTARMVDLSPGVDDVNSDLIEVEYRMSDGDPYQASHFSQGYVNAIMQPTFSTGQTYYPYYYRVPDRVMFDAIGWDYLMEYFLNINIAGGGSVNINPPGPSYSPGTSVEVTAIPDAGWEFVVWTGDLTGNANPDTILIDYDKVVTANFQTLNCTLNINIVGNGEVLREPELPYYPRGDTVWLTAVPDTGWAFNNWGGNLWGTTNPNFIVMNGDKTVIAYFTFVGIEENVSTMTGGNYFNVSPNPAGGRVLMRYRISDAEYVTGGVSLDIYNATGQLVKSFDPGSFTLSNESTLMWDGTDEANRQVGTGVYFIRFKAAEFAQTTKLLLIR
ncbi:MAG: zinc-dependent metalloprotease [candidate division WOR-3 bacterium]|nr:MAG: zinc-dependent metalloprotease [candidate division WOR-3 bacterium]